MWGEGQEDPVLGVMANTPTPLVLPWREIVPVISNIVISVETSVFSYELGFAVLVDQGHLCN